MLQNKTQSLALTPLHLLVEIPSQTLGVKRFLCFLKLIQITATKFSNCHMNRNCIHTFSLECIVIQSSSIAVAGCKSYSISHKTLTTMYYIGKNPCQFFKPPVTQHFPLGTIVQILHPHHFLCCFKQPKLCQSRSIS